MRKFYLEIATEDDDFTKFYGVLFNADLSCLDTNDEQRDNLLKSPSFLNVEKFRSLKFVGKKFGSLNNKGHLTGSLTLKDITKSLDITIEFNGKNGCAGWSNKNRLFVIWGNKSRSIRLKL
ncbi:YceI family protein [Dyadobacter sp. UP-52]|uniref:YceI family protein n=1 Tax=Dyadobacter subterraneus TaxID=2773304 RepID=A0ABR9W8S7_9BACT|nr:YceI family protein [Dyadobacter subterraneus]